MSEFVRVCPASQLPRAGEVAEFVVNGRALCVANVDGSIAVLDGTCPHEGGPLGEGVIEDGCVACPWHGYSFDPKTGVCPQDASMKAEVIESKLEEGELRAKL
jgi:nitrite reductase (NADH) small subunit